MGWIKDEYIYSKGILRMIAENYQTIYEALPVSWRIEIYNIHSIVEYKADFDTALNAIGRGHWDGSTEGKEFKDFKYFGRLQQIVIADVLGITVEELARRGFYKIPQLKGTAYRWMANHLNGLPRYGSKTKFIAKPLDSTGNNRVGVA